MFRITALEPELLIYSLKAGWKVSSTIAGEEGALTISAPNGTTTTLECRPTLRRAIALLDGKTSARKIINRIELPDGDYDELDAVMKRLMRLGCLELRLGRHRISNTRHDVTWDKTLYESE